MIETISLMYNIYIVDTILLLVRVNSTYATNVENKLFCWIFVTKGGPGANGRVLPPVTGGPGFELRSPRIAQARVRLATDTIP